jgi:2-haloacid dehalogenase
MLDFGRFEILTFDCYGTLINWEAGILRCLHDLLNSHGKSAEDATILEMYGEFEAAAEQGEFRDYRQVLASVVQQFGQEFGFTLTEGQASSLAESLQEWKPWPDTVEALISLQKKFKLAIISNVDDDLFAATRPQLKVDFGAVITAQQAQAYKPSLKIFDLALRRLGVPTDRILHIGQSIYHDVVPAKSLGIATVWVNRPSARSGVGAVKSVKSAKSAAAQPELQVQSLAELAALCNPG